jgi:hypothetical protein
VIDDGAGSRDDTGAGAGPLSSWLRPDAWNSNASKIGNNGFNLSILICLPVALALRLSRFRQRPLHGTLQGAFAGLVVRLRDRAAESFGFKLE